MSSKVILEAIAGPIKGQVFTFTAHDTFLVGRGPGCHAQLPANDTTVSRHHFILEIKPPAVWLRDLGSLNGTYVNGIKYGGLSKHLTPEQKEAAREKLPVVELKTGDQLAAGSTAFLLKIETQITCWECGVEIPTTFLDDSRLADGSYVCRQCRQPQADAPAPAFEPAYCANCGKDVSVEIGDQPREDYICQTCQPLVEPHPTDTLIKLRLDQTGLYTEFSSHDLPGYDLGRLLSYGEMGALYLARRKSDKAPVATDPTVRASEANVAVKLIFAKGPIDFRSMKLFRREIEVIRNLRHPNIVRLLDYGTSKNLFYFVMEYCEQGSLADLIEIRGGKLLLAELQPIMLKALDGLAYAHEQGYVHRDLKPQSILLTPREGAIAKIAGFDLAKNFQQAGSSGLTSAGEVAGTLVFMAREQLTNFRFVKPVSDVWSIAATFYYALTGKLPRNFPRRQNPIKTILSSQVIPLQKRDATVPVALARIIDRALVDNVKERYPTAAEFRAALLSELPHWAPPPPPSGQSRPA